MKIVSILSILSILGIFCSCEKSSNEDVPSGNYARTPETKPQYNNSSFGVYKGVIVGSTGTVIFRIYNGDSTIKAYLAVDNVKDTLSTSQQPVSGQPLVNINFVGRISSITISADANGANAQLTNVNIQGHPNARALILHENSTDQVLCYGGTLTGDLTGSISFLKVGTDVRSVPTTFLAKLSADNFFLSGNCVVDGGNNGRDNTHYMYDLGNSTRTFGGYPKFSEGSVSGSWVSFFPATQTSFNGSINCVRTY